MNDRNGTEIKDGDVARYVEWDENIGLEERIGELLKVCYVGDYNEVFVGFVMGEVTYEHVSNEEFEEFEIDPNCIEVIR